MTRLVLIALVGGATAVAAPRPKDSPIVQFPEGRWVVERYEFDGQVRDATQMAGYILVHTRTSATLEVNGREIGTERATWIVDGGHKRVDFTSDRWNGVKRAIWKLDGDTLTLCEAAPNNDRPTEFAAPKGSRQTVWVLKRAKE
jgi:uncharacterized protein (TIGR03067 family)